MKALTLIIFTIFFAFVGVSITDYFLEFEKNTNSAYFFIYGFALSTIIDNIVRKLFFSGQIFIK
jgi:hypothetical protein